MTTLYLSGNRELTRSLLEHSRDALYRYRQDYSRVLRYRETSEIPDIWDLHLQLIETMAESLKEEIKEIQNGTYSIKLSD